MKVYFLYPERDFYLKGNSQENDYNNIRRAVMEVTARCSGDIREETTKLAWEIQGWLLRINRDLGLRSLSGQQGGYSRQSRMPQ